MNKYLEQRFMLAFAGLNYRRLEIITTKIHRERTENGIIISESFLRQ